MLNLMLHVSRGGMAMAYCERPDGACIYYEVRGAGFPLLLIAPGGVNSQISFWSRTTVNALTFAD